MTDKEQKRWLVEFMKKSFLPTGRRLWYDNILTPKWELILQLYFFPWISCCFFCSLAQKEDLSKKTENFFLKKSNKKMEGENQRRARIPIFFIGHPIYKNEKILIKALWLYLVCVRKKKKIWTDSINFDLITVIKK